MEIYSFEFGASAIEIYSNKKIKEGIISELRKNVQFIRYDFNQNIHNSSAYRFNSAPLGSPFLVTNEFINFLFLNIEESRESEYVLMPFYVETGEVTSPINRHFTVDGNTIIKHIDIFLDTKVLIQAYVTDFIFEKLESYGVKNFTVTSSSFARSKGKVNYEIEFSIEDDIKFTAPSGDTAYCLHFNEEKNSTPKVARFANADINLDSIYLIINAPTCCSAKSLAMILSKGRSLNEYNIAANNLGKDIFVIDSNLQIHTFSPISN